MSSFTVSTKHFLLSLFSHMNLLQMKTALLIGLCNAPLLQQTHRGEMDESFYIQPYLRMLIASCHGITPERKECPGCKAQGVFPFPLFQCQLDYRITSGLTAGAVVASNHCEPCSCFQTLLNEVTAPHMHLRVLAASCIFTNPHLEL